MAAVGREVGGEGVPVWEVVGLGEGSSTFTVEILPAVEREYCLACGHGDRDFLEFYSLKLICCRSDEALLWKPRDPAVLTVGVGKKERVADPTLL